MSEQTGLGTKFQRENDSVAGQFDDIAQVAVIGPPGAQRDVVEVEDLAPANDIKQKVVGLIDVGEFTVTLNFDPELQGHKDLESDLHDGLTREYRIVFPFDDELYSAGGYYPIDAVVTGFAPQEISAGEVRQAEVTLTVKEKPEYVPAVEL